MARLVRFGLPLVPATILAAIVHSADQYLIGHFRGLSDVGVYALGYKLAFAPYSIITTSIGLVWSSALMYEIASAPNAPEVYARMTTYIMSLMVATLFCVSVFADTLVTILAAPSYRAAEFVIPVICLGLAAYGLHGFLSIGVMLQKRTGLFALTHGIAAVVNICLNLALIPHYGYMAAAWTSVATYVSFAGVSWFVYRRVYAIPFEWVRLTALIALCIGLFLVSRVPVPSAWMAYVLKVGAIGLLPVVLFVGGFLKSGEKLMLDSWYRALARKP
jgi:O-antigen/teichoic acid export membrane protein